jgi:hypothetical protein
MKKSTTTDGLRLCDVISVNAARRMLGLTERQMRWRLDRGQIESARLSDDLRVVLRSSVTEYAAKHGNER